MFLATGLIAIFGLRLSELAVLSVDKEGTYSLVILKTIKIQLIKKKQKTFACDLIGKPNLGKKLIHYINQNQLNYLKQFYSNRTGRREKKFGDVGQAFTDKLVTNKTWKEIISTERNKDVTPYSLVIDMLINAIKVQKIQ